MDGKRNSLKTFACTRCSASVASKRLPRGWKDCGGPTCEACLIANFNMRAISLPVAHLTTAKGEPVGEGFLRHFLPAWRLATDLANWAQQELLRRDVRRMPGMTTLPKYIPFPDGGLYTHWNATASPESRAAWAGATGTAATILKAVEDRWKDRDRLAVLWRGESSACTFRFPYPWVVRRQDWRASLLDSAHGPIPMLSFPLPGCGRVNLELDRRAELREPLRDFTRVVSGEAHGTDVKVVGVSRGGRLIGVKAIIAARFTRAIAVGEPERVATIRTGPEALLTVELPNRPPFVLYAMHLKGVVSSYEKWLERYRTDLKYEKRWPAQKRRRMIAKCKPAIDRQKGRIDSELKQACAAVVGFVARQRCAVIVYDDGNRDFLPSWPWYTMRERLSCLCGEVGIGFQLRAVDDVGSCEVA